MELCDKTIKKRTKRGIVCLFLFLTHSTAPAPLFEGEKAPLRGNPEPTPTFWLGSRRVDKRHLHHYFKPNEFFAHFENPTPYLALPVGTGSDRGGQTEAGIEGEGRADRGRNSMSFLISERMRLVLKNIIEDYILPAEPVGSKTVSKTSRLNLSPATIRNTMSDLEELGLIFQPHPCRKDSDRKRVSILC